ncbi:MAG: hypothetical protein HYU02_04200, partial [Thaumarchaeota archaeon]|nr:hypothetical protein [Nitrososphaerota archaeon]
MINSRWLLLSVSVIAILVSSTLFAAIPITPRASAQAQAQLPREQRNWEAVNHNILATNSNPQTQINNNNAHLVELKWLFPIPVQALDGPFRGGVVGGYNARGPSAANTPLIVDGIAYTTDSTGKYYALIMATGKTLWTFDQGPLLNKTQDRIRLRGAIDVGDSIVFHVHGFSYAEGKIFIPSPPCDVMVVDAFTGRLVARVADMCDISKLPGLHACRGYKVQSYGPEISTKLRIMVVKAGAVDESNAGCRAFFAAYDLDTYQRKWVFFTRTPLEGDKDWFIKVADKGWVGGRILPTDGGPIWDGSGRARQRTQEILKA